MKKEVMQRVREDLEKGESAELSFYAEGIYYIRKWNPRERLILLGGGHIAQPLCRLGAFLDFEVVVVDDRPSFANTFRFPDASLVICNRYEQALDELRVTKNDYICIITRGHRYDAECLRHILDNKNVFPHYLGMIGSRRRVTALKNLLLEEGYDKEVLNQVNAPIGLPIHSETTAEIAVSIAAQMIQYRRADSACSGYLMEKMIDEPLLEALGTEDGWVLAIVLETKGSTPVKSGAIMAVNEWGQIRGTIGGGCSEAKVINTARYMANKKERKVMMVDMTNDIAEEEGMVCGGTMKVLVESME